MSVAGRIKPEEWEAICHIFGNKCLRCQQAKPLTLDHIVPLSKGGENTIYNVQPLCKICNLMKSVGRKDYRPTTDRSILEQMIRQYWQVSDDLITDVRIYVTATEKRRLRATAKAASMTVSDFIRSKIGL